MTTSNGRALAPRPTQLLEPDSLGMALLPALPREHQDILRKRIAIGATDAELELFLMQARAYDLDPFRMPPEVWLIPRSVKVGEHWITQHVPQIGRDGLLKLAKRSGRYLTHDTEYRGADGVWTDDWLDEDQPPAACRVRVPIVGTAATIRFIARYREFVQWNKDGKPTALWAKMPAHMLEKCALTHALKRLPDADFGSLEVADEEYDSDGQSRRAFWAWADTQGYEDAHVRQAMLLTPGEHLGAAVERYGGWNKLRARLEALGDAVKALPPAPAKASELLYDRGGDPMAKMPASMAIPPAVRPEPEIERVALAPEEAAEPSADEEPGEEAPANMRLADDSAAVSQRAPPPAPTTDIRRMQFATALDLANEALLRWEIDDARIDDHAGRGWRSGKPAALSAAWVKLCTVMGSGR